MIYTEKKYALINTRFGIKKTLKQACYPEILSKIDTKELNCFNTCLNFEHQMEYNNLILFLRSPIKTQARLHMTSELSLLTHKACSAREHLKRKFAFL